MSDLPAHHEIERSGPLAPVKPEAVETRDGNELRAYLNDLAHRWSMTLSALAFTLVPAFFLLDYMVAPPELLGRFAFYRGLATVISHPIDGIVTCDAGHKSVSADAGIPSCTVRPAV